MARLACGDAGGDAAGDARGGDFVVLPGDADGRGIFGFGSVELLGQYAAEAALKDSWGNARADAECGGFSFVPSVSRRRDGQSLAGGAGDGRIAERVGRIARRQTPGRGDGAAVCAVYEGEV